MNNVFKPVDYYIHNDFVNACVCAYTCVTTINIYIYEEYTCIALTRAHRRSVANLSFPRFLMILPFSQGRCDAPLEIVGC